jgi:putative salt-induced outer membrane protein YdiY
MTHNLKYFFCTIVSVSITLFGLVPVAADEIVLQSGDRLTGVIVKMEKGVLTLKTGYSPPIEIQTSVIRQIRTENSVEIRLSDGKVLKGKISSEKERLIKITPTDQREAITITTEEITAINPPPVKWEGGITLGGNMQQGNTERTGVSAAIEGVKRREKDRLNLRYLFNYGEEKTQVTTRNHFGVLKYDYFFLKKIYGYLVTEALNDTFKDIKLRITIGPGIGYQVWEDQTKKLGVEAGLSYLFENHENKESRNFWEARLAANFRYNFNKYLVFSEQVEIYPNLEYGGQYRLRNEASIRAPLGAGWAMYLSHILDYVSNTADEKKKTDTNAILGLQYMF